MADLAHRGPRSELEEELLRREVSPTPVGDVFSSLIGSLDRGGAVRSTWSAGRAWYAVNGDIERAHTTGVFVRDPVGRQTLPTLVVYVDSRARVTDFTANREVYLARLENAGLRFAEVVFRESRRSREARPSTSRPAPPAAPASRELTEEDERAIERMCAQLPPALRDSVSRAMRESWETGEQQNS